MRFHAQRLLIAGYTARNLEDVRRHVEELARQGVPRPARIPDLYLASPAQLRFGGTLWAYDGRTSGEVEYVLAVGAREVFVAIGSDHTDRELERSSIEKSKQSCPKVIARQLWPLNDLLDRWDTLRLRSFAYENGVWTPYQDGSLAAMMHPSDLQRLVGADLKPGTMVFSGTLPLLRGEVCFAERFAGELVDNGAVLARFAYNVSVLQPSSPTFTV